MKLRHALTHNAVLVLDGGFGTTLESLGCNINSSLWSAEYLKKNPDILEQAHTLFSASGADIILTNTYQAAYASFNDAGYHASEIDRLIHTAVDVTASCKASGAVIVGSLGPYAAYRADGSEYTGQYEVSHDTCLSFHKARIQSLIDAGISDFVFETVPNYNEIKALTETVVPYFQSDDLTFWLSCTVNEAGDLVDGTDFNIVTEYIRTHSDVWTVFGINCSTVTGINQALSKRFFDLPLCTALYPNGGKTYDGVTKTWSGTDQTDRFIKQAVEWQRRGVTIIGGCCGILPHDIRALSNQLK